VHNAKLLLAHSSVRQQLIHVSSVQFSYVVFYAPLSWLSMATSYTCRRTITSRI